MLSQSTQTLLGLFLCLSLVAPTFSSPAHARNYRSSRRAHNAPSGSIDARSENYEMNHNDPSNSAQPPSQAGSAREDTVSASIDLGSIASIAAQIGGEQVLVSAGLQASASTASASSATSTPISSWSSPTPSSSPSSSSSDYDGKATFFTQGGVAGACGTVHSDSDLIVALDSALYGAEYCGKSMLITNTANGKSVTAAVADKCPGCPSEYSLDLSTGTFDSIGDKATGVLSIKWAWA